ncbi:MAG: winged helix-turn-helix domain-containing protein [Pirellulales bacterium]|nr:winged helix-turn-helix domain-containing protein [Pirellulales bacterium]
MTTTSELVIRLRELAMNVAKLEVTVGRCAQELQSLLDLAANLEQQPPPLDLPHHGQQLHVGRFTVDRGTFSVSDGSHICELGNTVCFRFFECLARDPNRCFTRSQLLTLVWDSQRRASTTVRSAIFELRCQFRKAGMNELADALRAEGRAYGLKLDESLRRRQRKTNR